MTHQTLSLSDLPATSDLYTVEIHGSTFGIGTPDELRELIADGILNVADPLRFRVAR